MGHPSIRIVDPHNGKMPPPFLPPELERMLARVADDMERQLNPRHRGVPQRVVGGREANQAQHSGRTIACPKCLPTAYATTARHRA